MRRRRLGVFGMRVGVFLLLLLFALAMASSPAVAQVPPAPDVLKPDKEAEKAAKEAEKAAKKAAKEAEKAAKEAEKAAKKAAKEAEKAAKKAAKEAAKAAKKDDDDGDEPDDVGADGGSGAPGSGKTGGPGGPRSQSDPTSSARTAPSTDHFGATGSLQSSSSTELVCTEGCASPTDVAAEDQGDSILAAESGGELQAASRAFSYTESANAGPGVLMLFALMALGLAVGIAGGLIALRGRLRED